MVRSWTLLPLLLVGCAELASVERLRCGNGLHELQADEDCDGLPPGSPLTCGTPGSAAACRFTCVDGGPCPDGWTCGADDVCRIGAGFFDEPTISPLAGERIAIGDVDGDGHDDVVAQSTAAIEVAFGTRTGEMGEARRRDLPAPRAPPSVGDIDDDGYADIVTYGLGGPIIHRGRPDRYVFPVSTPIGDVQGDPILAVGVRATRPFTTRQLLAAWQTDDGVRIELDAEPVTVDAVTVFDDGAALLPHPPVGDLDGGGDIIALAVEGGRNVEIARILCADAGCALTLVQAVPVPGMGSLSRRVFLADMDGDGDLDLLAHLENRGTRLAVSTYAPETGFGPFDAADGLQPIIRAGGPGSTPSVLVAADVVGDGRADLATDVAFFMQTGGPLQFTQFDRLTTGRPAQQVFSADTDGDRRSDLVVIDETGINMLTFDETDRSVLTTYALGGLDGVAVGDFDGDGRDEVITHQVDDGALFYTADQGLELIAVLDSAPALLAASSIDNAGGGIEPATLHALGRDIRFALEGGSLGAPYTRMTVAGVPRFTAVGRLIDGQPGLVVGNQQMAANGQILRLPGAGLGARRLASVTDTCPVGGRTGAVTRVVAGSQGRDSAILELTTGFTEPARDVAPDDPMRPLAEDAATQTWRLRRFEIADRATHCDLASSVTSSLAPVDVEVIDIDDDGRPDVVALLIERVATGTDVRRTRASALGIWRATAEGWPDEATVVDLPAPTLALAMLHLGDVDTLVLAGEAGLQTAAWDDDGLKLTAIGDAPARVQALAAADVDGDGLDDLIVKTVDAVRVARQPACTARAVWEGRCLRGAP